MRKHTIILSVLFYAMILLLAPFATVSAMAETDKVVTATPGDTSKELQALLDYNKNGDYNLTIKIPAGNYDLTSELRIYSNTTIIADPQAYLIKKHTKGAMIANDMKILGNIRVIPGEESR